MEFGFRNLTLAHGAWLPRIIKEAIQIAKEKYKVLKIKIKLEDRDKFKAYVRFWQRLGAEIISGGIDKGNSPYKIMKL